MAAYPFPRWLPFWRHVLQDHRLREPLAEHWVRDLSPKLDQVPDRGPSTRARWSQPDPAWATRAKEIVAKLERGEPSAIELARGLLEEQKLYAQASGDSFFVVRSACNFAARLRESNPRRALEWVHLALDFDPWNEFAWNTTAAVNLTFGNLTEAADAAWEAVRRFPNDPVAHNGLAEVLKAQGRPAAAEAVYRHVIERFQAQPDAIHAFTGLADLLRHRGEWEEAERLFIEALRREPNNEVTRAALARLRAQCDEVIERHSSVPGAKPPSRMEKPEKAENLRGEDLAILLTDTLFLRRWSRELGQESGMRAGELRERAHAALERLLRLEGQSSLAAGEAGLLTLSEGDLDEGLKLLREAARRFPGSARVRYALARAERLAVSAHALDLRDPGAPIRPWRRLARLEPQLGAVALLGEARTWLGQTDGAIREAGARKSLGRLAFWIEMQLSREGEPRRDHSAEINAWWARETRRLVFGDRTDRREEDLGKLPFYLEMVQTHATELDLHEEDAVYRVATA
jgi:tetratricopeptide (TPR) repeat protein